MQPAAPEISTCPTCGGPLEKTPDGGLGCMSCLLRAECDPEQVEPVFLNQEQAITDAFTRTAGAIALNRPYQRLFQELRPALPVEEGIP